MSARLVHLAWFATVAVYGCGGDVNAINVAPGCPTKPMRGPLESADSPADLLISDLETSGNPPPLTPVTIMGRDGYWIFGEDRTATIAQVTEVSSKCVAHGKASGHYFSNGSSGWNSNWTAVFKKTNNVNSAVPYDARAYKGISFFAAFGGDTGKDFPVPMGVTTMDNAWNGGICRNSPNECMDFYRLEVPLNHEWRQYVLLFDDMAQKGWGIPQTPMKKDKMVGFIVWPDQQFDIWIDDVRFVQ